MPPSPIARYLGLFLCKHIGLPLLLVACASAQVGTAPSPAVLRVSNATTSAADVFVDGYLLAVAPAGRVRSVSHLPTGPSEVSVVARDGSARLSRRVVLEPGRDVLVELNAVTPLAPLVPHSGIGGLELANPHASALAIFLDGESLGTVFEKSTRRFDDQMAGAHALLATDPEGVVLARFDVVVEPAQLTRVELDVPTGDLILANGLDEDLAVSIEGISAGVVAPGTSLRVPDLLAGRLDLEATGLKTFRRHRVQVVLHADEIREVSLAGTPGSLRVKNGTAEEIELRKDGALVATVPAGHTTVVDDVPPGRHRLEASGRLTGQLMAGDVTLEQGESVTWELDARYGLVTLRNDSSERQRLSLDGLEVAMLPPFRGVDLATVRAGAHAVEAVGSKSGARIRGSLEVSAGARALFVVPAGGVRLSLKNTLDEGVRVYRDATWLAEVDAGAVRHLDDVPGGAMLLEAVGLRTERVLRKNLDARDDPTLTWEIRREEGVVSVQNDSGERLRASPELSGQHESVGPGEVARFTLAPGRHRLTLVGVNTGLSYTHAVDLRAGALDPWVLSKPQGTLQVFNRTAEPASLQVNQQAAGVIPAGGSVVLRDVRAGRVGVVAKLEGSGQVLRHAPFLQPGGLAHWELERSYARVLVENGLGEAVRLEIDGQVWTRLDPGEARVLDKVMPGKHRFVGVGARSDTRVEAELDVSATRDTRWAIEGTRGVLAVTNRTAEALVVDVGGRALGSVPAGATKRFSAPAGKEALILRGATTLKTWRQWLTLSAGRTWDLAVDSLDARFRVTNRLAAPVTLAFAGRRVDTVAPGATLEFEEACAHATVELSATSADTTTHARKLACRINEVHEWTIE